MPSHSGGDGSQEGCRDTRWGDFCRSTEAQGIASTGRVVIPASAMEMDAGKIGLVPLLLGRNHNAAAGGLRNHNVGARSRPCRFLRFPLDVDTSHQRTRTDEQQRGIDHQQFELHAETSLNGPYDFRGPRISIRRKVTRAISLPRAWNALGRILPRR